MATKTADLTLALQKAKKGFIEIVDRPTDNDIITIQKLLLPVLMKTKYDELTLTHNLSGVILPTERYEHIYKKGDYLIPPVIALYGAQLTRTLQELKFTKPMENMKPKETTVHYTKRPVLHARTSSWNLTTKHGTRS